MSAWMDITVTLADGLPPWPGDRPFRREIVSVLGDGGSLYNLSALAMSAHAGTHVDAPLHFIAGGAAVDTLDPDLLIGSAFVLDMDGNAADITDGDLSGRIPPGVRRLLIKTRNSRFLRDGVFCESFIALTEQAAGFIAASGVRLLGMDSYSVGPFSSPAGAHKAFLSAPGAIVLENIDLIKAREGWYDLVCLPLRIAGGEGAPARALIRKREEQCT
jgi:arylformamidase